MDFVELKTKLSEFQKDGWCWTTGYTRDFGFEARIWKRKPGFQSLIGGRTGRFIITEPGSSPENALENAIRRLEEGRYGETDQRGVAGHSVQGEQKEELPNGKKDYN